MSAHIPHISPCKCEAWSMYIHTLRYGIVSPTFKICNYKNWMPIPEDRHREINDCALYSQHSTLAFVNWERVSNWFNKIWRNGARRTFYTAIFTTLGLFQCFKLYCQEIIGVLGHFQWLSFTLFLALWFQCLQIKAWGLVIYKGVRWCFGEISPVI